MRSPRGKVLLAMSGGVDSSVAAALLKDDGYDVVGAFMRLGSPGESLTEAQTCDPRKIKIGHQGCCSINDAKDAQHVAARLDIPLYVLNFRKDFGRVMDYFVDEYNAGRTPNPCVRCNDWLKFGRLWDYARSIDARYVASGHYARIVNGRDRQSTALARGVDATKDQSYVLFGTPREHLSRMLLPVGHYHKSEIRRIAAEHALPVSNKPDSQEICFVPDQDYAGMLKRHSPQSVQSGAIRDVSGSDLGEHPGHQHFTIGQRRGVGVALGYPIYVVQKDAQSNTITLGPREALAATGCKADQVNWLIDPPGERTLPCTVKIRYNAEPVAATVRASGDDELTVSFQSPQYAVAPGQVAVCYDQDRVICGGWIREADQDKV